MHLHQPHVGEVVDEKERGGKLVLDQGLGEIREGGRYWWRIRCAGDVGGGRCWCVGGCWCVVGVGQQQVGWWERGRLICNSAYGL